MQPKLPNMSEIVYLKTELGRHAFKERVPGISFRQRSALILFDGVRTVTQVLTATAGLGVQQDDILHLQLAGVSTLIRDVLHAPPPRRDDDDGGGRLLAPMNGRIVAVLAQVGDLVVKGQPIAVLEAMKMQHEVTAQRDGTLAQVAVREGDQVATRQLIAALV